MKKIIVTLVIIGIIIALVVWLKGANPVQVSPGGTVSGEYSMKDIVALGKDLVCDLRRTDSSSTVVGSVVTSGGKARGDFDISTESVDMPFASHFIFDNGVIYTWTSLAPIGYRTDAKRALPQGGVVGLQDKAPYQCQPWNADLTRFQLPSGINFQEVK